MMQEGKLFTFYSDPYRKIPVFLCGSASRCVLWFGGQCESFFSLPYFPLLAEELEGNWCFAQMQVPSSNVGYSCNDHVLDAEAVDDLIGILLQKHGMKEIALFATSTGVQVALEVLRAGQNASRITRVILHGIITDTESGVFAAKAREACLKQAYELVAQNHGEDVSTMKQFYDIPVTPARVASGGFLTLQEAVWIPAQHDDAATLCAAVGAVRVPLLLMIALQTRYNPPQEDLRKMEAMVRSATENANLITVSYFTDTCDERRRLLKTAEAAHAMAITSFLRDLDELRDTLQQEKERLAIEAEKKAASLLYNVDYGCIKEG